MGFLLLAAMVYALTYPKIFLCGQLRLGNLGRYTHTHFTANINIKSQSLVSTIFVGSNMPLPSRGMALKVFSGQNLVSNLNMCWVG